MRASISHRFLLLAGLSVGVSAASGCKNQLVTVVDGVLLADCTSKIDPPSRAGVAVSKMLVATPDADAAIGQSSATSVQLAIERGVPWPRAKAVIDRLKASGKTPVLLCGNISDERVFTIDDVPSGGLMIQMVVEPKGKFCVQTPELPQAYCVQGSLGHIPRADVRQTMRETVKKWERTDVAVTIDPGTEWADVLRAIDGARTCCGSTEVRVALKTAGAKPYEFDLPGDAPSDANGSAAATGSATATGSGAGSATAPL